MGLGLDKIVSETVKQGLRQGIIILAAAAFYASPSFAQPMPDPIKSELVDPDLKINYDGIDYSYALPQNRTKIRRATDCIVVHSSEGEFGGFDGSLSKLWAFAEAHFIIDRKGRIYQIIHPDYIAYHAGVSRWNGMEKLENHCIGVEFIDDKTNYLTLEQYIAGAPFLRYLKESRKLTDSDILGHYQVAYWRLKQNKFKPSRGRKVDPDFIEWSWFGINHRKDDPDVEKGEMLPSTPNTNPEYHAQKNRFPNEKPKLPVSVVSQKNLRKNLPRR